MFHVRAYDMQRLHVHDIEIFVDVFSQKSASNSSLLPTFPLNTDGVDPSGVDILIERVRVTNFDDAIVPKPLSGQNRSPCTERVLIRDIHTVYSVGLSIGSVPPHVDQNCIRYSLFFA